MLRKLIREPIVHFIALGAVLFLLAGRTPRVGGPESDKIIVTSGQLDSLTVGFTRTWMRPPTQEEIRGLVDDFIREEILYRQAMAMGLDRDDTIVRRRMRQKLEFLTEDTVAQSAPPTEQELQAYLDRHQDQYREERKLTYEHIFFNREKRGKAAKSDAEAVLAQLKGESKSRIDLDTLGDAFLLPFKFVDQTGGQIAQLFGDSFGKRLTQMPPGQWTGPIESSYGLHLVRVDEQIPGRVLPLAMVHDTVLRELMSERRRKALDAAFVKLRQRYSVVIEQPTLATIAERR
jgi:parvulin-like peptidyl-prolyl isomerase